MHVVCFNRRILLALVSALICLHGSPAFSTDLDPPHDAGFGSGCLTCHDMTAFSEPNLIPTAFFVPDPGNIDWTLHNSICWSCHDDITAPDYPTHSSLTSSNKYGDWTIDCTVCHNQHTQEQDREFSTSYGKFIRRTIDLSKISGLVKTGSKKVTFTAPADMADGDPVIDGICEVCHTQTAHFRNDGTLSGIGVHTGLTGTNCTNCHFHSKGFKGSVDHSGFIIDDNETGVPANICSGCHTGYNTAPETAHSACNVCHTTPPTLVDSTFPTYDGQLDDDGSSMFANLTGSGYSAFNPLLDGEGDDITALPAGAGAGAFQAIRCGFCHAAKPGALAAANHGGHAADHFVWEGGCDGCHSATPGAPTEEVVQDIHGDDCDLCHSGGDYNAGTNKVGDNGDGDATLAEGDAGTWTSTCVTCHNQAQVPGFHGITVVEAAPSHNNLGGSKGAWADSGGTIPSNRAAAYSGKIDQDTYGGLLAADYNCADCHAADHASFTPLEALQVHTFELGSGGGNCLTCHNASMVADEITTGKGASVITIECEDCHSITNGNGPSGKEMYQYDGIRHHKTVHAQSGNCTRCHADPRPADLSGEPGHAGTAAINDGPDADGNTWNDGFGADFGLADDPTRPTQMACRLCHTNYETYTVNVRAEDESGADPWDTSELDDLHGYNKYLPKHPPDHGLTIFADDYDTRGTSLTFRDRANLGGVQDVALQVRGPSQTTQVPIPSHRIDSIDGTYKIEVYNYGACFSCHTVQMRHASPLPDQDYDTPVVGTTPAARNTFPYDVLRYTPGRSVFNDHRGVGFVDENTWDHHAKYWAWNTPDWGDRGQNVFNWAPPDNWGSIVSSTKAVHVNANINMLEGYPGTPTHAIRQFDTGPSAPVIDDITITVAQWNGSWVSVEAQSSIGSGQDFSFTYTGTGGPCNTIMIWDTDHYEGTCYAASGWVPTDTVTVSNTSPSIPSTSTRVVVGTTSTIAIDDSYIVTSSATTQLLVLQNDPGRNNEIISTDTTNLSANCTIAVIEALPSMDRIDITCGPATGAMGSFDYEIQGDGNTDTGTVTITATGNLAPAISINEPDGIGDTVAFGTPSFDIDYTLADGDSVATVNMYYDTDTVDYDGVAIGTCTGLAEGTATCSWTTSGLPLGTYYVYGVAVSPDNSPIHSAYSGVLTVVPNQPPVATDDGTYTVTNNSLSNFTVLANDSDGGDGLALSLTAVGADSCGGLAEIAVGGTSIDYTAPGIAQTGCTFTYTVTDTISTDQGTVTVDVQLPPTITVNQPDSVADTGAEGGSYTINYDANDSGNGDPISVDFFYDNNNSGEDGTAIASCQNLVTKGAGLTCSWTSLPPGSWWVYGVVDDGTSTASAYSPGTVVVSATPPSLFESFAGGGERTVVGTNFAWTSGSWDTACDPWLSEINATTSADTGPATWVNQPYVYVESSTSPCGDIAANNRYYLESPLLDASVNNFFLSFDYNSTGLQSPDIEVWVRDGAAGSWVQHGADVISDPNNAWTNETARDLSSAINSVDSAIRIVVRTSSTTYTQDVAIDNIYLDAQ